MVQVAPTIPAHYDSPDNDKLFVTRPEAVTLNQDDLAFPVTSQMVMLKWIKQNKVKLNRFCTTYLPHSTKSSAKKQNLIDHISQLDGDDIFQIRSIKELHVYVYSNL